MQYLGNKKQLAKKFAHIILEELEPRNRFVEPFCGSYNLQPALQHPGSAYCSDIHPGMIALYSALQGGWTPPTDVDEEEYARVRAICDWDDPLTAFVAFGCSFGAKEWGGYARGRYGMGETTSAGSSARSLAKKIEHADTTQFRCHHYSQTRLYQNDVLYCDPPYANSTGYKVADFDHDAFHDWLDVAAGKVKAVFVSEYTAHRDNWDEVWSVERRVNVQTKPTGPDTRVDRLFRVM